MGGAELVERLRAGNGAPFPVVVLSAMREEAWRPPPGVQLLRKPIDLARMLEVVKRCATARPARE
jgi:CheY-like chemotaxis protein